VLGEYVAGGWSYFLIADVAHTRNEHLRRFPLLSSTRSVIGGIRAVPR
jgi:hypothetical protein